MTMIGFQNGVPIPSRRKTRRTAKHAYCLGLFLVLFGTLTRAQTDSAKDHGSITFVQLTDPHLFDDGWQETPAGAFQVAAQNWQALVWSIMVNALVAEGKQLDFVVLTGDLGLQNVEMPATCTAAPVQVGSGLTPFRFDAAVSELAREPNALGPCKREVKTLGHLSSRLDGV
jgi:hypothetical protein